jgi:hypothetical protein
MEHYRAHWVYCSITGHERISDTVEFFPQHCKVPGLSSADAATIAALDLVHALNNPAPTKPFKQPGTEIIQAIKKLAAILESMAPEKTTTGECTEPAPKMTTQPTPRVPTPMVPTPRVQEHITPDRPTDPPHVHARRSPRGHRPPQVTQEERAYQLLATPLPRINKAYAVTDVVTGQQLEYRQLLQRPDLKPIWEKAFANELGRLAQGVRDIKGTDTIVFIHASEIPRERTVTYGRLVCDIRHQKAEQHRVRLTVGGDRINYPGETSTQNADLTTSKCLWSRQSHWGNMQNK